MTVANLDIKLRALEAAMERAKKNHRALYTTKRYGEAKREVKELFAENVLIADLFPAVWYGKDDRRSTESLIAALSAAKVRLTAAQRRAATLLVSVSDLLARGRAVAAVGQSKRASKTESITIIEANPAANEIYKSRRNILMRRFRASHTSSETLAAALREIVPATPDVTRLLGQIDLFRTKNDLKIEINTLLRGSGAAFGDLRPRKWVRVDHAPMEGLVLMLDAVKEQLQAIDSTAKLEETFAKIDAFIERLEARKRLKVERDESLAKAKELEKSLTSGQKHARELLARIIAEIAEEDRRLSAGREDTFASAVFLTLREKARRGVQEELRQINICIDEVKSIEPDIGTSALRTQQAELRAATPPTDASLTRLRDTQTEAQKAHDEVLAVIGALDAERAELAAKLEEASGDARTEALAKRQKIDDALTTERAKLPRLSEDQATAENAYSAALGLRLRHDVRLAVLDVVAAVGKDEEVNEAIAGSIEAHKQILVHKRARLNWKNLVLGDRCAAGELALGRKFTENETRELELRQRVQTRTFLMAYIDEVDTTLVKCRAFWKEYRDIDALVFYVRASEDVYNQLLSIARLIRGRRNAIDSMGHVKLMIMIEVGVCVGYDLGFANLSAEVGITLGLAGTLGLIDSRELMFSSRISIYLSAGAKASVSAKGAAAQLDLGDVLPVPDVMVEASVKCAATLYDAESCSVYDHEEHWATRWAHAIARRIAFLKRVKLTRRGFETLSSTWLDEQVSEIAASEDGHSWIKRLADSELRKEPRHVKLKLTGGRLQAQAAVSAGESGKKGTTSAGGTFALTAGATAAGTLIEDTCEFLPVVTPADGEEAPAPSFRGKTVYHALTPDGATEAHEYVEVTMSNGHSLTVGDFNFSSAATRSSPVSSEASGAFAKRRSLSIALEVNPATTWTNRVQVPKKLEAKYRTAAPTGVTRGPATRPKAVEHLERTIRYRMDILQSQGKADRLTVLYNRAKGYKERVDELKQKLADHLEKAGSGIDQVEAQLDSMVSAIPSVVPVDVHTAASDARAGIGRALGVGRTSIAEAQDVLQGYDDLQDAIKEKLEAWRINVDVLENSHNIYSRWYFARVVSLDTAGTGLSWSRRWTPQVYRGLCARQFSMSLEQTVPIVPAVKVYFRETVKFECHSAEFEVLGPHTFSYLKLLFNSLRHDRTRWDAYWAMHKGEVFDICEQVGTAGSIAFSELAHDALNSASPKKEKAAALGTLCWSLFNTRENPFTEITEAKVIAALKPAVAATPSATTTPVAPTPIEPPTVPVIPPPEDHLGTTQAFLDLLRQDLAKSWSRTKIDPLAERLTGGSAAYALLGDVGRNVGRLVAIKQELAPRLPSAGIDRNPKPETTLEAVLREVLIDRNRVEGALVARLGKEITPSGPRETLVELAETLSELVADDIASLTVVDQLLFTSLGGRGSSALQAALQAAPTAEDQQALCTEALALAGPIRDQATQVPPNGEWGRLSKVGVPRWLPRSKGTIALDHAVAKLHTDMASVPVVAKMGRSLDQRLVDTVRVLSARLELTRVLQAALVVWADGKDERTSRRAPNVACFLELPLLREQDNLLQAMCLISVRQRIAKRMEQQAVLTEALEAHKRYVKRRDEAMGTYEAEKMRVRKAVAEAAAAEARRRRAAQLIQRNWRSQRAKLFLERMKALPGAVGDYLEAFHDDHAHDALCFGQKKTIAPGQRLPLYEVPEDTTLTAPKATRAPSRGSTRGATAPSALSSPSRNTSSGTPAPAP